MGQQASHETLPGIYANNIIHPPLLPLRAEAGSTGALPDPCARREIHQGMGEEEEDHWECQWAVALVELKYGGGH